MQIYCLTDSVQFNIPTKEIAEKAHATILRKLRQYLSIPGLGEQLGTNSFTLKKVFNKYYGISEFALSRQQRIDKARELVWETNCRLQTIADLVGYTKGNNFQAAFKTVVGYPLEKYSRRKATG